MPQATRPAACMTTIAGRGSAPTGGIRLRIAVHRAPLERLARRWSRRRRHGNPRRPPPCAAQFKQRRGLPTARTAPCLSRGWHRETRHRHPAPGTISSSQSRRKSCDSQGQGIQADAASGSEGMRYHGGAPGVLPVLFRRIASACSTALHAFVMDRKSIIRAWRPGCLNMACYRLKMTHPSRFFPISVHRLFCDDLFGDSFGFPDG